MKCALSVSFLVALCLSIAQPVWAQEEPAKYEYGEYYVILADPGPNWKPQTDENAMATRVQILKNLESVVLEDDNVILAGLINDGSGAEFIMIVETADEMAMRKELNEAPNVKNGFFKLRIHSFSAPAGLKLVPIPRK